MNEGCEKGGRGEGGDVFTSLALSPQHATILALYTLLVPLFFFFFLPPVTLQRMHYTALRVDLYMRAPPFTVQMQNKGAHLTQ